MSKQNVKRIGLKDIKVGEYNLISEKDTRKCSIVFKVEQKRSLYVRYLYKVNSFLLLTIVIVLLIAIATLID